MSLGSKNYYELLGVERDAPAQAIRDAYKELARIYHPDSHFFDDILESAGMGPAVPEPGGTTGENETFKAITEAYNTLNNAAKRAEYDSILPRETLDWDVDAKSAFEADQLERQFQNPDVSTPHSWGSFGRLDIAEEDNGAAMSPHSQQSYRAVSEIIRENRSLAARLRRFILGR